MEGGREGLTGRGVSTEAEGGHIVPTRSDFHKGNVLAGSSADNYVNHGTQVGQNIAGDWGSSFVGVAYGAKIIWGPTDNVDIDNNSWGISLGNFWSMPEPQDDVAIAQGRGGLGQIVIYSGGNGGPNANDSLHSLKKEPAYMAIVSLENSGGFITSFSNSGDALQGAVPARGGTSFAAPHTAGITALMLESNPGLGFRDVQEILAYGANYLPSTTPYQGFALNQARTLNGVGLHYSRSAGFGSLNAYNSVRLAQDWFKGGFSAATVTGWTHKTEVDTNTYTISATANQVTRWTIDTRLALKLDSMQVQATYTDPAISKLVFKVTSPSGTTSVLATGNLYNQLSDNRVNENIKATSKRFWGEQSEGTWTIEYSHAIDITGAAQVKDIRLIFFGDANEISQRHIYTDERHTTWTQLASDTERQRMLWLDDHDGGQDVIMASALSKAITVQLGRNGWLQFDGLSTAFAPGTRVENAFGGDGNDVLIGRPDGPSLLLGNLGADVLMGYGQGSELEGGDDGDWLWLGGNTVAKGGEGADRFVVFNGHSLFNDAGQLANRLADFNPNEDVLISYTPLGTFEIASFDLQGKISDWVSVIDPSYLQQLQTQWHSSSAVNIVNMAVNGSSVTLDFGMLVSDEGLGFSSWTVGGSGPQTAQLTGSSLSLNYSALLTSGTVINLSAAQLYSPLGRGLEYQQIHLGDSKDNALDASSQAQAVVLYGAGGNDQLRGGSGSDLLIGATGGISTLTGGAGADVFRMTGLTSQGGVCRIGDFSIAQGDRLDLDALFNELAADVDFLDCVSLTQSGQDLVVSVDTAGHPDLANDGFNVQLLDFYSTHAVSSHLLERLVLGAKAEIYA